MLVINLYDLFLIQNFDVQDIQFSTFLFYNIWCCLLYYITFLSIWYLVNFYDTCMYQLPKKHRVSYRVRCFCEGISSCSFLIDSEVKKIPSNFMITSCSRLFHISCSGWIKYYFFFSLSNSVATLLLPDADKGLLQNLCEKKSNFIDNKG